VEDLRKKDNPLKFIFSILEGRSLNVEQCGSAGVVH
jgi:hypothetical protein